MTSKLNRSIANKLNAAQVAISNTLADADLQAAVAVNGYTPAKMDEGRQVYERAVAAVDALALAWAGQKAATRRLQLARKQATAAYQSLAKVARVLLDEPQLTGLGLHRRGGMPRRIEAFVDAADVLFVNGRDVPDTSAQLTAYGYGPEWINREYAKIAVLRQADSERLVAKAERGRASILQTLALRELTVWLATYIKIARIVLHDRPQLLEKIGVKVRTTKSAAQLAGPQKAAATRRARRLAKAGQESKDPVL